MRNLLLLTSTVRPLPNVTELIVRDPAVRMDEYRSALEYYVRRIGSLIEGIVYADNCGMTVNELRRGLGEAATHPAVEVVSVPSHPLDGKHGKGFGEMKLIDDAMNTSKLLQDACDDCIIWKLTGRYRVLNIRQVIRCIPPSAKLYIDRRTPWIDMRVMAFTRTAHAGFLRGLYPKLSLIIDDRDWGAEVRMFDATRHWEPSRAICLRHRCEPLVSGIRGSDGRGWTSPRHLAAFGFRWLKRSINNAFELAKVRHGEV